MAQFPRHHEGGGSLAQTIMENMDIVSWKCPEHGEQGKTLGNFISDETGFWPLCPKCVIEKLKELGVHELEGEKERD